MNKMNKECKVVMLPTKKSKLIACDDGTLFHYHKEQTGGGITQCQHLYLISDEEIKEGDWYIDELVHPKLITEPLQMKGWCNEKDKIIQSSVGTTSPISTSKKIIATTNNDLNQFGIICADKSKAQPCIDIPKIPESFVKAYVEVQGKIDKVMVEYDILGYYKGNTKIRFSGHKPIEIPNTSEDKKVHRLKTREDNTVIIHKVKK